MESVTKMFIRARESMRRKVRRNLGVGLSGIDAIGERTDIVAQRTVGAVNHYGDGRQDERVFCHRLERLLIIVAGPFSIRRNTSVCFTRWMVGECRDDAGAPSGPAGARGG